MSVENNELIKIIIDDIKSDLTDEDVIHILLEKKVASNKHLKANYKTTFGDRAADKLASFVGSWLFVSIFLFFILFGCVLMFICSQNLTTHIRSYS